MDDVVEERVWCILVAEEAAENTFVRQRNASSKTIDSFDRQDHDKSGELSTNSWS